MTNITLGDTTVVAPNHTPWTKKKREKAGGVNYSSSTEENFQHSFRKNGLLRGFERNWDPESLLMTRLERIYSAGILLIVPEWTNGGVSFLIQIFSAMAVRVFKLWRKLLSNRSSWKGSFEIGFIIRLEADDAADDDDVDDVADNNDGDDNDDDNSHAAELWPMKRYKIMKKILLENPPKIRCKKTNVVSLNRVFNIHCQVAVLVPDKKLNCLDFWQKKFQNETR